MRLCWSHRARSIRGASMNSFHARRASNPRQHGSALRWVALSASTRATCTASRMNAGAFWMVGTGHRNPACRSTSSSACRQGARLAGVGRNGALWFIWSRGRRWARTSNGTRAHHPAFAHDGGSGKGLRAPVRQPNFHGLLSLIHVQRRLPGPRHGARATYFAP